MHDLSASSKGHWLPEWSPDSSFLERYRCTYAPALAFSVSKTHDFETSEEVVQDAFVVLHNKMLNGSKMSLSEFLEDCSQQVDRCLPRANPSPQDSHPGQRI